MVSRSRAIPADAPEAAATWEPIDSVQPWDRNPRKHSDAHIADIRREIERDAWGAVIVVQASTRRIIAGHGRLLAAKAMGLDRVPVRAVDVDDAQAARMALADNQLTHAGAWDDEVLAEVLRDLAGQEVDLKGIGWSDDELDALLAEPKPTVEPSDDAPEVQDGPADSVLGQVYELGVHRLVCGDSTRAETWALVSDGVAGIYTDPPYGIAYSGKGIAGDVRGNDFGQIIGDADTAAARAAFSASRSGRDMPEVWWGAHYYADAMPPGRAWLVWDKMVVGDVYSAAELAWTSGAGRTRMFRHQWHGMVRASERGTERVHPTQKPVAMAVWAFGELGFGRVVADLFAGSGSTLLACAATGRVARCIELDPRYCDVIRRRWTRYAKEAGIDPGSGALDG